VSQQALPRGATRRRAAFGLLDADGWTWAGLKATFWFLFIIFMLGVIPNAMYTFTTGNTVSIGYNFISIVNLCPADNEDLPCPAPTGATLPWQTSPAELALPTPLTGASVFQSGSHVYLIGGSVDGVATADVLATEASESGNLAEWTEGPALPEPRSDAAIGMYSGIPFVMGGLDASGAPTDTVYKGVVEEGVLTGWELADGENGTDPLTLPQPISGASVLPGTSGFMLLGGRDADGQPTSNVHVAWLDEASSSGRLLAWQPLDGLGLPEPRADAVAATVGDFNYVVGGNGPDGPVDTVFRLELSDREPATDELGQALGWAIAPDEQSLPAARADAIPFSANGSVYVIGGYDDNGDPQNSMLWAVPDTETGGLDAGWQQMEQMDLPYGVADAPLAGVGSNSFIFGGQTADGPSDGSLRAGLSPDSPFFQLGIAGATLPALSIKGEVGQQLGYLNAFGVGMTNFVILIIIGVAFSRPEASRRVLSKLSRGHLKVPPEDEYRA
jgi:hypothetical protein